VCVSVSARPSRNACVCVCVRVRQAVSERLRVCVCACPPGRLEMPVCVCVCVRARVRVRAAVRQKSKRACTAALLYSRCFKLGIKAAVRRVNLAGTRPSRTGNPIRQRLLAWRRKQPPTHQELSLVGR
jgi:hypothetical protein